MSKYKLLIKQARIYAHLAKCMRSSYYLSRSRHCLELSKVVLAEWKQDTTQEYKLAA